MISSSRMELLELFLPIASNSPTKTFLVMGYKGPISHFFTNGYFNTTLVGPSLSRCRNINIWFLVKCLSCKKTLCKPLPHKNFNHKAPRLSQPRENSKCNIIYDVQGSIRKNGWRMGLTYPFETSLILFSKFEIEFVQKLLHIQCKNCLIKSLKIKITQEFRN